MKMSCSLLRLAIIIVYEMTFLILTIACNNPSSQNPQSSPLPPLQKPDSSVSKQPQIVPPLVGGFISGLSHPSDKFTIYIYTEPSQEKIVYTSKGNTHWGVGIQNYSEGRHYKVIAKSEGYETKPESYLVSIVGHTAYVVSDNQTGEEAIHLDFRFIPKFNS